MSSSTTNNMEVESQMEQTPRSEEKAHGRTRIIRFLAGGGALAGMVFATMLTGVGGTTTGQPILGTPQTLVNGAPQGGETDISRPAGPEAAPAPAQPDRLYGASAVNTAIAVAQRAFPGGASRVYVARLDNPVDALPASALTDGPVLLVPSSGHVPPDVFNAIKALHPSQIVVLGGPGAISEEVKQELSTYTGIGNVVRIAGATRVATAIEIAKLGFAGGAQVVYLADSMGSNGKGSPDAVAAGVLSGGPILTANKNGSDNAAVAAVIAQLGARQVVALGGEAAVPSSVLNAVAGSAAKDRVAGADRYQTSVAIGKRAFPNASRVYLASGTRLEFPLIAGSLTDGPIILVPGQANGATRNLVTSFGNPLVTAIGNEESVTQNVLQVAAGYAQPATQPVNQANALANTSATAFYKYSQPASPSDSEKEAAVFAEINAERVRRGVQPLQRDPVMDDAARAWAQQVARTGVFEHSHGALKYADLFPKGWRLAGENMVGYYFVESGPYAQGARQLWVNSPGHLANLQNPVYNRTGIGVATGRDWVYCVQNFGQY